MKTALLIGDSISNGYRELAGELLSEQGVAVEWHSGGSSAQVLAGLGEWIDVGRGPDVVHFNCGLHDSRYFRIADAYQQPLANYEALLSGIVRWLQANTSAQLVWATTTPVIGERIEAYFERNPTKVGYLRRPDDIAAYNDAAAAIMAAAGVPVNDLYAVVKGGSPEDCLADDGVHMTAYGYELLARAVADGIRAHLRE